MLESTSIVKVRNQNVVHGIHIELKPAWERQLMNI